MLTDVISLALVLSSALFFVLGVAIVISGIVGVLLITIKQIARLVANTEFSSSKILGKK